MQKYPHNYAPLIEMYPKILQIIEQLEVGQIEIKKANAIVNAIRGGIELAQVQLKYEKMKHDRHVDHLLPLLEVSATPKLPQTKDQET
jgi:hypothetical protein